MSNPMHANTAAALSNIHPADELASIREEISQLEARERELRAQLMAEGASLQGSQYLAVIRESVRETVDKNALIDAIGRERAAPFLKKSAYKTITLTETPPA